MKNLEEDFFKYKGDACYVHVRVKPNAQKSQILGYNMERNAIDVALNAMPHDGEANTELINVIRKFLGISGGKIRIFAGEKGRDKVLEIKCDPEVAERLRQPDEVKAKRYTKSTLPSKDCASCGRPFEWRKKWQRCWDEVRYCSDRCRNQKK